MTAAAWGVSPTRTRSRYGAGAVRLEAGARDASVELRVHDDGPGFPPGFLPRAFERFSRADGPRGATGAGLGLAIVAAIARDTQAA